MPPVKSESECEEFFEAKVYKTFTDKAKDLEKHCPVKPVSILFGVIVIWLH